MLLEMPLKLAPTLFELLLVHKPPLLSVCTAADVIDSTLLDLYAAQFGLFSLGQFNRQHAVLDCRGDFGRIDGGRNPERTREHPRHYFPKEVLAALRLFLLVPTFDG